VSVDVIGLIVFMSITALVGVVLIASTRTRHEVNEDAVRRGAIRRFPRTTVESSATVFHVFDQWFARTLFLSGLDVDPITASFVISLLGTLLGSMAWAAGGSPIVAGAVGVLGGTMGVVILFGIKGVRVHKFQNQFPGALELLARAVRAGESFDQAVALVGQSAPEPVAIEFRRCARHLEMGLSISAATEAFFQRMHLIDVRIFCTTVTVHRSAGGHLAETLERLSTVIRDRLAYRRQLRAVTGAGRLSAILISALGPILFIYLFCFQADYGSTLWQDSLGRSMLMFAVLSELVGLLWVARLLRADY